MRLAIKFGVLALAAWLSTMPTLACLVPTAALTEAERECCKQMADQCGTAQMPMSPSCCQRLANRDVSNFVVVSSQHTFANFSIAGNDARPIIAVHNPSLHIDWFDGLHGPPESPPVTASVLRI